MKIDARKHTRKRTAGEPESTTRRSHVIMRSKPHRSLSAVATIALVAMTAGLITVQSADAAFIVQPSAIDAVSSEVHNRAASEAIDGSSLSNAAIVETDDPIPATYPSHDTSSGDIWWTDVSVENNIDEVFVTFDLGDTYKLTGVHVWNLNHGGAGGRSTESGIENVNIEFSLDGTSFFGTESHVFTEAPNSTDYAGEDYAFASGIDARHVRFDVQTTFENDGSIVKDGDPGTAEASNRAGLSEVRFTAVIPEPASFLLLALSSSAVLLRRRRRASA